MLNGTGPFSLTIVINNDNPTPINRLKVGLARVPVIAIFEYPLRAIVKSANKSPVEFPIAKITIPK